MDHFFAKIKDNIVLDVIVADQDFINSLPSEEGVTYVETQDHLENGILKDDNNNQIGTHSQLNSASIDGNYDPVNDVFYAIQDFPSWKLDSNYEWQAPIVMPEKEGYLYFWDEDLYQADNTKGWVEVKIEEEETEE